MILHALSVILSLVVIEGLLSVDNALGIAALAKRLPPPERRVALRIGFIGAYGFRVIALLLASWIIQHESIKLLGALYLVYLMCSELSRQEPLANPDGTPEEPARFWPSVWKIGLMDLSLSVDNVITAVAFSKELWLVCTGVLIGIITLRLLAGVALGFLAKYPILEKTAFLLVGYVGLLLIAELVWHVDFPALAKFAGIVVLIAISLLYSRRPAVHRSFQPFLRAMRLPMAAFAWLVEAPFRLVFGPILRLVKPRDPGS
ncbi:MAG: TerC family protein [Verrucomicrobiales bacterium]